MDFGSLIFETADGSRATHDMQSNESCKAQDKSDKQRLGNAQ